MYTIKTFFNKELSDLIKDEFSFDDEIDRIFYNAKNGVFNKVSNRGFKKVETDGGFKLFGELPSFSKEDLKIDFEIDGKFLLVDVLAKTDKEDSYQSERKLSYKDYVGDRKINQEKVEANFENGLLTITFVYDESSKVKKNIKVV